MPFGINQPPQGWAAGSCPACDGNGYIEKWNDNQFVIEPCPKCTDKQLEMLPEWDGSVPVPYGVIPF